MSSMETLYQALNNGLSFQSAIKKVVHTDITNFKCCHSGEDSYECTCNIDCWKTFAALVCKYGIHETIVTFEAAFESHQEHPNSSNDSQTDLSFTSDPVPHAHDSDCQSCEKCDIDKKTPPKKNNHPSYSVHSHPHENQEEHVHEKHDHEEHDHEEHDQEKHSDQKEPDGDDDSDPLAAIFDEPHIFSTTHHHHYKVMQCQNACIFHKEFAMQKYEENRGQCICIWIRSLLSLMGENTRVADFCCNTAMHGEFVTRECCLGHHSHSPDGSQTDEKYDPIPMGVGKAIRHLSLGVSGMTCTSCENKLSKTLKNINGVIERGSKGVKTNFMQGRADIWYNEMFIENPEEEICKTVEKKTGFTCAILNDSHKNEGGRFSNNIRLGVNLPAKVDANALIRHVELLKGVEKVTNAAMPSPSERSWAQNMWDRIRGYICPSPAPDLEKGLLEDIKREVVDVRYDPQMIHVRDIPQHIRSLCQPPPSVSLVDVEKPEESISRQTNRALQKLFWRTIFATILTVPILIITWTPSIRTQIPAPDDMDSGRLKAYISLNAACFTLATIVQFCGWDIYLNAYRSVVWQHYLDMDCLVTISTTAAYIYSCIYFAWNVQRESRKLLTGDLPLDAERERHDPIFEASTLLITLILAGRLFTGYIRNWATNRISVGSLQETICRRSEQTTFALVKNRNWRTEDARLLHYGDVLLAEAGESIVTDGVVINGAATLDQSHLTGEANPTHMEKNSPVMAGSKVIDGKLEYRVTRLVSENTISSMKQLIHGASDSHPRMQDYADKVASWLTPIILAVTIVACISWLAYYRTAKSDTKDTKSAISKAITVAITVLALSCPCAVALAVPTVLIFSTQVGVKNGIVIKTPAALEKAAKIRFFVADKTGTLTTGKLEVVVAKYWVNEKWEEDRADDKIQSIQSEIYQLIARERHPVARAVLEKLRERQFKELTLTEETQNITSVVGSGIEGIVNGRLLRGGKPSWVLKDSRMNYTTPYLRDIFRDEKRTPFIVIDVESDTLLARFGLQDSIRPEAASVIAKLKDQGIDCYMISGDQTPVCRDVARAIGIPKENVYAECSPEQKARHVQILQYKAAAEVEMLKLRGSWISRKIRALFKSQRRYVLFIGDGTNDAAALTRADVGLTMSNCTEIAAGCSDAGILSSSLTGILALLALSTRAMTLIRCNFTWALKYNVIAVLVSTGLVSWTLPPQYAGIGEAISVAPVFIIASAILWRKLKY